VVDRNESETTEQVSIIESVNDSPVPDPVGNSFVLWWSLVTHMQIQDFVNMGYTAPDSLGRRFRPPGDELIPRPKPNEAVVFCDFFVAGLQFPLEKFVSDVLEIFVVQLHQLTPNAVARLSFFAIWP
jgi:hypothetical protein